MVEEIAIEISEKIDTEEEKVKAKAEAEVEVETKEENTVKEVHQDLVAVDL